MIKKKETSDATITRLRRENLEQRLQLQEQQCCIEHLEKQLVRQRRQDISSSARKGK